MSFLSLSNGLSNEVLYLSVRVLHIPHYVAHATGISIVYGLIEQSNRPEVEPGHIST